MARSGEAEFRDFLFSPKNWRLMSVTPVFSSFLGRVFLGMTPTNWLLSGISGSARDGLGPSGDHRFWASGALNGCHRMERWQALDGRFPLISIFGRKTGGCWP